MKYKLHIPRLIHWTISSSNITMNQLWNQLLPTRTQDLVAKTSTGTETNDVENQYSLVLGLNTSFGQPHCYWYMISWNKAPTSLKKLPIPTGVHCSYMRGERVGKVNLEKSVPIICTEMKIMGRWLWGTIRGWMKRSPAGSKAIIGVKEACRNDSWEEKI